MRIGHLHHAHSLLAVARVASQPIRSQAAALCFKNNRPKRRLARLANLQEAGLLVAAATRENVSPSVVLELLRRVGGIIRDYCGVLSEEAVRKNCVLVYELLDEVGVARAACLRLDTWHNADLELHHLLHSWSCTMKWRGWQQGLHYGTIMNVSAELWSTRHAVAEKRCVAAQVIDYGFPQSSSSEALKEFVLNEPIIVRGPVRALRSLPSSLPAEHS